METKNQRICVVGAGNWGLNHIRTLFELGALGGVVEHDLNVIKDLKLKYSCKFHQNLEDALRIDYDGFIVATPAATHFELAKIIINQKKSLLVEKPLTLNLQDAIKLNELAKMNKVNLMVGHLLLFHPAFIKINELIESDLVGEIQYIYSNRLNLGTIRSDENVFWSFAPHDISLFNYFFKDKPVGITSRGAEIIQNNIHDTTITTFEYKNKKMGHIFVSWLHPFKEHRFVIIGSKGMIHFDDSSKNKALLFYEKKEDISLANPRPMMKDVKKIHYEKEQPLKNELKYFLSCLNGKKPKIANGDSGVEVIRILEEANKSLKIGSNAFGKK